MKKNYLLVLAAVTTLLFTACNETQITHNEEIAVTDVILNKSLVYLRVGAIEVLTATVIPADAANRNLIWSSHNPDVVTIDDNGIVTAISVGTAIIIARSENGVISPSCTIRVYDPTYDAGVIINDITWSTRNVNAPGTFTANPQGAGMFYQWNRRVGWSSTNPMVNSDGGTVWNSSIPTSTTWERANDPCPQGWRIPTLQEFQSLNSAGITWTENWNGTGVNGHLYGTSPNQIFLPAAGWRPGGFGTLTYVGTYGHYWSSTQNVSAGAWTLQFSNSGSNVISSGNLFGIRVSGHSVRCVAE